MQIEIYRRKSADSAPYWEIFAYTPENGAETVANALRRLNERDPLTTAEGAETDPIGWECGCLQKKCGACAMRINGMPALACSARLSELGETVRLEPLRKFPCVRDLIVDRSILFENLKTMGIWAENEMRADGTKQRFAYEASRCLQCGCCLEICPNFAPEESFFGMAAAIPAARLIAELPVREQKTLVKQYRKHFYAGCGKSLACRNICPAGIDTEHLMVRSNAAALWRLQALWNERKEGDF